VHAGARSDLIAAAAHRAGLVCRARPTTADWQLPLPNVGAARMGCLQRCP